MRKFTLWASLLTIYLTGSVSVWSQQWETTGTIVAGGNGYGNGLNQLSSPSDAIIDSEGNVYVADGGNSRVMKWAPGATEGVIIAGGLGWSGAPNGLAFPTGLWLDDDNTLYIVDCGNQRVQMWTEGATEGITVAGGNGFGNDFNQLNFPGGMYKKGNDLYIVDAGNSRVLKWTLGESEGVVVAGGNGFGLELNQLAIPTMNGNVYVDEQDNVYVTEYSADRVTKWAPGATEGVVVADISALMGTTGQYAVARPSGIEFFNDKMLVTFSRPQTSNPYRNRVTMWQDGEYLGDIISSESNQVAEPMNISFDANYNLYVTEGAGGGSNRVKKFDYICSLTASVENQEIVVCEGEDVVLSVNVSEEGSTVNWYDSEDAETPVFVGTEFDIFEIVGTHSFWVEAHNHPCTTERIEVVVTVNPAPVLEAETTYEICSGNEASLYANSPSNVIFWYANEDDTEYLYHGNLFVTEELTEDTTFWVEAYNLSTGCTSERIEVTITVSEAISAPTAQPTQEFQEGLTLADLEVEHTGTLTWYADAQLTQELPETTVVVVGTTYYVTQSSGACESGAIAILVDNFLGNGNLNQEKFAYYPNPVKDVLNFSGKELVKSVQIYDLSGKLILNQTSNSISRINLSVLPKGAYVVKAQTDKGINTFKIVKN